MSIKSFEHKGVSVRIEQDTDGEDPRNWDNAGTMVCFHGRYTLGDKHDHSSPSDFERWWKENGKGGIRVPLYLYDHSGITMNTTGFHCPWDSGQVGYIYATRETVLKEWGRAGVKRVSKKMLGKARECLVAEVATYDEFITGQVYGYIVGNNEDSCWGFYGLKYCIEQATDAADHAAKSRVDEQAEAHRCACADIATAA